MPVRITFFDDTYTAWVACDWLFDSIFFVDLIINFFSAYFDNEENLIAEKKVNWLIMNLLFQRIVRHYLTGWFVLDLLTVFPFSEIGFGGDTGKYNDLFRVARLPRLYRLIKIVK